MQMAGRLPYVKERLDSGRVLGGLCLMSASQTIAISTSEHTILESQVAGRRCVLSGRWSCRGSSNQAPRAWRSGPSSYPLKSESSAQLVAHAHRSQPPGTVMSTASKLTLAATSLGAVGIVIFVHYAQRAEKTVHIIVHIH